MNAIEQDRHFANHFALYAMEPAVAGFWDRYLDAMVDAQFIKYPRMSIMDNLIVGCTTHHGPVMNDEVIFGTYGQVKI